MDNFTSAQYDRFEAYRRHALPKQAVRKVRIHVHGFDRAAGGVIDTIFSRLYSKRWDNKSRSPSRRSLRGSPKSLWARSWRKVRYSTLVPPFTQSAKA